jgi:hypothetical protein
VFSQRFDPKKHAIFLDETEQATGLCFLQRFPSISSPSLSLSSLLCSEMLAIVELVGQVVGGAVKPIAQVTKHYTTFVHIC